MNKTVTKSTGASSEELFMEFTGALKSPRRSNGLARGDVILDGHYVEIKYTSGDGAKNIRATRYIPVVVHSPKAWYVVPPNEVVAIVLDRKRGMNCEIVFENGRFYMEEIERFACAPENLRAATLAAVAEGERWPRLKAAMLSMDADLRELGSQSRSDVSWIVAETEPFKGYEEGI